ncbi:MAG TPA: VIT1/CCC1 transporter family protein [Chloroflexota bacterium]|nr:VIT1/CCC1 transporter family protein [Chloroflexota bacterium]
MPEQPPPEPPAPPAPPRPREPRGLAILRAERWHEPLGRVLREIVFGMNDGLISSLGFVAGASGAFDQNAPIIIGGLAALVAGTASMAIGGYLSVKAQREFYESEIRRELYEMTTMPEHEREEVRQLYRAKGFEGEELERIVARITANRDVWLKVMMEEELGLFPEHDTTPLVSASYIGTAFALGALVPILPYFFLPPLAALGVALALAAATLFAIGAAKARLTRRPWLTSGLEITAFGLLAAAIGFLIGHLVGELVPGLGPLP